RIVGWYQGDLDMGGSSTLMPVEQKNAGQLGLYDMSGNVWEWCFTVNGSNRVVRGGIWQSSAYYLRVGYWVDHVPYGGGDNIGFRFARTAD
ncbi:MAG TPA: sulfatase-modifying factor protein, partial [Spirochaeta sp.]|nr:sulfatase-modifying factor protein [Spirochaeta sp.]